MRSLIIGLTALGALIGCATDPSLEPKHHDASSSIKARAVAESNWERWVAILKPDLTMEQVESLLEKPRSKEFESNQYIWLYSQHDKPMELRFDRDGKLVSWKENKSVLAKREYDMMRAHEIWREQSENDERRRQSNRAIGNSLSNEKSMGEFMLDNQARKTNCTSRRQFDGSVKTECD